MSEELVTARARWAGFIEAVPDRNRVLREVMNVYRHIVTHTSALVFLRKFHFYLGLYKSLCMTLFTQMTGIV